MRFLSDSGYSNLLQPSHIVKRTTHNNLTGLTYIISWGMDSRTKNKEWNKAREGCHLQPRSPALQLLPPQCVYQDGFRYQPYCSMNGWPLASYSTCDSLDFTYPCSGFNLPIPGNGQKIQWLPTVKLLSPRERRWHAHSLKHCVPINPNPPTHAEAHFSLRHIHLDLEGL